MRVLKGCLLVSVVVFLSGCNAFATVGQQDLDQSRQDAGSALSQFARDIGSAL